MVGNGQTFMYKLKDKETKVQTFALNLTEVWGFSQQQIFALSV